MICKMPVGYVSIRHQAAGVWYEAVVKLTDLPHVLFTVKEPENILTLGTLVDIDLPAAYSFLDRYVYVNGPAVVSTNILTFVYVLMTQAPPSELFFRLTTKVNSGTKQGATMGISGLVDIHRYLNNGNILCEGSTLSISHVG